MGFKLGARDLGLRRAYGLRAARAERRGVRLRFKVRNERVRDRAGL